MFDFHEKRKIRRVLYSKLFIIFLFLITLVLGKSAYERYIVERGMAEKLYERQKEFRLLEERAALLESKVEHLKNERGIEEELRGRFDVAKEGEQVVIILDEVKESTEKNIPSIEQETEKNFLEMLKFW